MRIAIIGEYSPQFELHQKTNDALRHSATALDSDIESDWISTSALSKQTKASYSAFWISPGSPYRDMSATLDLIRFCRTEGIPCFGTSGGFQHMVIEYARNCLGIADADHAEYDPYASRLIVSRLACSLAGPEMEITLAPDSKMAKIYQKEKALEQYYCNFGVNPTFTQALSGGVFRPAGSDAAGEIRVVEISEHPFFIGTLYVPQARSTPNQPHSLVTAFVYAAHKNKKANEPINLTTMPSALLAFRLRSSLGCQKQVVAGHRGR